MDRDKDRCGICEQPFPANWPRFLHFVQHIRLGEAVGHFDKEGNWFFSKVKNGETPK